MPTANSSLSSFAVAVLLAAVFLSSASAFNITIILQRYPNFSQLNDLLSSTQVAAQINKRRTVTLLAVDNNGIGDIASKPAEVQKRILQSNVLLDYYDQYKLGQLQINNMTEHNTLFQTTGIAQGRQGVVLIVRDTNDNFLFGPGTKGSPVDAQMLGAVAARPYNISVLQITHAIIPNGIDGNWAPPALPNAAAPVAAQKAPAPAENASPAASPEESAADATAAADAPALSPTATDAPAPSPADGRDADAPIADDSLADADSSSAVKLVVSGVAMASLLVALL